jgi:hypothetical protein
MESAMKNKILLCLFFTAVFINFLGPIVDPDFPFHLKTGEYIWQHREIPKDDPFSFYGEGVVTERERFTLSQYWIAQLIFYKLYLITGPAGIILLRASVFSAFIFLLWFVLRKRGMYSSLIIATLTAIMFQAVKTDRPQFFSFLFTLILVLLLERFREKPESQTPLFFIPPLMLLWANMHAGFVFGIAIIVIYTLAEASKLFVNKSVLGSPLDNKSVFFLSVTALIAVFFSYINPDINGQILTTLESHADADYSNMIYGINREYISPMREMSTYYGNRFSTSLFFCLLGFVSIVSLLNVARTRSADATVFALIAFSSIAALTAVRYIPFFIATAVPLSRHYSFFKEFASLNKFKKTHLFYILFGVFCLYAIYFGLRDYSRILSYERSYYPEDAAKFLLKNRIGANIFNQFNKGSYLLWRLYPDYRLFNDTRFISLDAVKDTDTIANAVEYSGQPFDVSLAMALSGLVPENLGGIKIASENRVVLPNIKPLWKKLLEQSNIDLIVHEACNQFSKEIYPLILRLIKDDEWTLIYLDGKMLIFVRNKEEYSDIINKYRLPKEQIYDEIILETLPLVRSGPTISAPYSSLAFAFVMKGEDEKARKMLDAALDLDKNDLAAHFSMAYLALKQNAQGHAARRLQ